MGVAVRALVLGLIGLATGCGYGLVGQGTALPPGIQSIAVPAFENRSDRPGLEQWISEAVARELAGRGGISVPATEASADAVLRGRIDSYNAWPALTDADGRAIEYQIVVVATVKLDTAAGETLLEVDGFRFQERYEVPSASLAYSDLENLAVQELSSRLAESLVSALFEGF